jgi:hypothetical protein
MAKVKTDFVEETPQAQVAHDTAHQQQLSLLQGSASGNAEIVELAHAKVKTLKNYQEFVKYKFSPNYEERVRVITNPNGRGNAAYDMDAENAMPVQDKLVKVWGWFHGNTGFSAMFRWASGRQDAYVIVDNPNASEAAIAKQAELVESFRSAIELRKKESTDVANH